jgi:hypothetical protein
MHLFFSYYVSNACVYVIGSKDAFINVPIQNYRDYLMKNENRFFFQCHIRMKRNLSSNLFLWSSSIIARWNYTVCIRMFDVRKLFWRHFDHLSLYHIFLQMKVYFTKITIPLLCKRWYIAYLLSFVYKFLLTSTKNSFYFHTQVSSMHNKQMYGEYASENMRRH